MNRQNILILLLLIQFSFSSTILVPTTTLSYQNIFNNFKASSQSTPNSNIKTLGLRAPDAKEKQFATDKQSKQNQNTQDTQVPVEYYKELISKLGEQTNLTDLNTPNILASPVADLMTPDANPTVIAQPSSGKNSLDANPIVTAKSSFSKTLPKAKFTLFTETLGLISESNKNPSKGSIFAYIPKKGKYSLNFQLLIKSLIKIDANTKVAMTINANNNTTTLNLFPGTSRHVATFQSKTGINEISISIKVETSSKFIIYAFLQKIQLVQAK